MAIFSIHHFHEFVNTSGIENYERGERMAFPDNLKRLREMRGISTAELAESAGIAQPQIVKYESGTTVPNAITAVAIAERLGTTVESLVRGNSNEA